MSEVIPEDIRSPSPGTPPPTDPEDGLSESPRLEDGLKDVDDSQQGSRGKKRHRRAHRTRSWLRGASSMRHIYNVWGAHRLSACARHSRG